MREVTRHFENLSRKDILAARPGSWGDYKLLDVMQHFDQQRDWDRAMAVGELILRSPQHSEDILYQDIYLDLAQYYQRRDNAAALSWSHAVIAYTEQHAEGLNRVNHWRDLAEVYLQAGDADTGLRMFTRILRTDPSDIWTYNVLGSALSWAGLHRLAVEVLDKALQMVKRSDPEVLGPQLTEMHREAIEKQAQEEDRTNEVDPGVLAEFRDALKLPAKRKASRRKRRKGRWGEIEAPPYLAPIDQLLRLGPARDDALYAEILGQGNVLVPELIWMGFDPELYARPAQDPDHHAPDHAVALLRELRDEAELDELSLWLDRADGDWYTELLTDQCGKVGGYTTGELEALAADTTYDSMVRASATGALAERANKVPAERERIVEIMRDLLSRPEAHEIPEEETFVGFMIGDILDMDARSLYPDIERAYDEDRVDTMIIDLDDVHRKWNMKAIRRPERRSDGMHLRLRCKGCGRERIHFVQHVVVDTSTLERQSDGEDVEYSPYIMDRPITCPKCGTVDRYELTGQAQVALLGPGAYPAILSLMSGEGLPADLPENPRVHYFQSHAFGRPMHPFAALEEYQDRINQEPEDAELHMKMGNVLRTLGRPTEAMEKYQQALELDPDSAEVAFNVAMCAHDLGDKMTAKAMYERVLELSSEQGWFDRLRGSFEGLAAGAMDGLARLKHNESSPWAAPWERAEATPLRQVGRPPQRGPSKGRSKKRRRRRRRRK